MHLLMIVIDKQVGVEDKKCDTIKEENVIL